MNEVRYISVILPLRLEWEPCYSVPYGTNVTIGDRVKVVFANRTYIGVVSATDITPDTSPEKIRVIESIENGIAKVLPLEIELWRKVSEYYLTTIGEVYKAAYPYGKIDLEEARAASRRKSEERLAKVVAKLEVRIEKLEARVARKHEMAAKARKEERKTAYLKEAEDLIIEIGEIRKKIAAAAVPDSASDSNGIELQDRAPAVHIRFSTAQKKALQQIRERIFYEILYQLPHPGRAEEGISSVSYEAPPRPRRRHRNHAGHQCRVRRTLRGSEEAAQRQRRPAQADHRDPGGVH